MRLLQQIQGRLVLHDDDFAALGALAAGGVGPGFQDLGQVLFPDLLRLIGPNASACDQCFDKIIHLLLTPFQRVWITSLNIAINAADRDFTAGDCLLSAVRVGDKQRCLLIQANGVPDAGLGALDDPDVLADGDAVAGVLL